VRARVCASLSVIRCNSKLYIYNEQVEAARIRRTGRRKKPHSSHQSRESKSRQKETEEAVEHLPQVTSFFHQDNIYKQHKLNTPTFIKRRQTVHLRVMLTQVSS